MKWKQREFLGTDLADLEQALQRLPPGVSMARLGLEHRRNQVKEALQEPEQGFVVAAEASVVFGGDPVHGQAAIDAEFGGDMIRRTQKLVQAFNAFDTTGPLKARGALPNKRAVKLLVSGTVQGSFGFNFIELQQQFFDTPASSALRKATWLMAAAKHSDEAFARVIQRTDKRIGGALKEFFARVSKGKAVFRLQLKDSFVAFNVQEVQAAHDRVSRLKIREEYVESDGLFTGVYKEARTFEYTPDGGATMEGDLSESLDPVALRRLIGERCHLHLRRVETEDAMRNLSSRFTLLAIPTRIR